MRRWSVGWARPTRDAVIVSEEQGEVDRFKQRGLDIVPHRTLIKNGFDTDDGKRLDVESTFKKEDNPFRIAIVCAMLARGNQLLLPFTAADCDSTVSAGEEYA